MKCSICKTPLTAIRITKKDRNGYKVYEFTYYCKKCDKIPKNKV